ARRPVRAPLAAGGLERDAALGLRRPDRRLVRHRDRAPAVGGAGTDAHRRGGGRTERRHGPGLAGHVRGRLCVRVRLRRLVSDAPGAARAGSRRRRARPGRGRPHAGTPDLHRRHPRRGLMDIEQWLPVAWFVVICFGILMYVVLDSFVLGLGILAPLARIPQELALMMNTAAPIWDGNETWLVLGAAGLMAAFPAVYALVLSSLSLPVLVMVMALVFRGVAFEFRIKARSSRWIWGAAFFAGSLLAAMAQGMILGAIVEVLTVEDGCYVGGAFGWF